ncbi:Predicted phosphohydrolase or phosphomutase, AlkP superfamily [Paucidesulfovibrio gracilis DSM 16080]|uniref:Predicted phosphohydrolase or phosphomutase, AlkP superfamily n=2 Tax=Paucidesulfovibrio TaxID=2910985 RepID=A0A1T4WT00_9BACT|nr:Predicted phosphohydrolase or phosphomutase, AlkP superfamily [Paucidesulfovibrio gracilis DSM 16080]
MEARSRLLLLGLDGLPLSLARDLAPELPNLARIVAKAGTVEAELPELSPVNWTSLATGQGPEVHGVFGFSRLQAESFDLSIVCAEDVACPTIFDHLGKHGLISRVINLPNTYPARPLRGMLVSGFVAEQWEQSVYPPFLAHALPEYQLEADTIRGADDPAFLLQELHNTLRSRRQAVERLWPDLDWDVFVVVLTETDRLFHFLYPAMTDSSHPWHAPCRSFLQEWDRLIGRILGLWDALPGPKRLMVMADHGFTTLRTEVDVNAWLRHNGFLRLSTPAKDEWDATAIAPESAAFALDPGRVYLHTRERFPSGILSPNEAKQLLPQLKQGLEALTFNGERVMERVFTKEELYRGPQQYRAPDLVCLAREGFDLKAKFDREQIFGTFGRTGAHTAHGAIFYDSHGWSPERMRHIGQEVLRHFNISESIGSPTDVGSLFPTNGAAGLILA